MTVLNRYYIILTSTPTNETIMPNCNPKNYNYVNMSANRTHKITACAGAMLQYFGCMGVTWNARTEKNVWADTLRRNGYSVRSRYSKIKKGSSVGGIRKTLSKIAINESNILAFVVRVKGHVLVINCEGQTIVDTSPRKVDRRKVISLYAIMKK